MMVEYLLEVTVCWVLLYFIFFVSMRRETFFEVNRLYLLSSLLLGLLLPMLHRYSSFNLLVDRGQVEVDMIYLLQNARMNVASNVVASVPSFSEMAIDFFWMIYVAGAIFFFYHLCKGMISIYRMYQEGTKEVYGDHEVVWSEKAHLPFSFFNKIYISKFTPIDKDFDRILRHELAHVKAWHSADILLAEILTVLFWFHPMIYFYKTALRQTHEYLADDNVVRGGSRQLYGQLLLRQSLSGLEMALVHQFFQSHIKKRINMIYRRRSGKIAWFKYALSIPVLGFLALSFTGHSVQENTASQFTEDNRVGVIQGADLERSDNLVKGMEIEPMASAGLLSPDSIPLYILDGVEASQEEIETLDPNNIQSIEVLKGPKAEKAYPSRGSNGVLLISLKSTEEDRSFQFIEEQENGVIPIADLEHVDKRKGETVVIRKSEIGRSAADSMPLFILDGAEVSQEEIEALDPDMIQRIDVLKGVKAREAYPSRGDNGVVLVSLKATVSKEANPVVPPLTILNGERVDPGVVKNLAPDNIATVDVLKGEAALKAYPTEGENGVVIIRTKQVTSPGETQSLENTDLTRTILIDGKIASESELESIAQDKIRTIVVLSGEHALEQYPDVKTDAVIVVTTGKISSEDSKEMEGHSDLRQKRIVGVIKDGSLDVRFEGSKHEVTFHLHDIEGRLIYKSIPFSGSEVTKHSYDVSHLPSGIYVISAMQDREITSEKISIVQ